VTGRQYSGDPILPGADVESPHIYSFKWAQQVVEDFTEKYARATSFVVKMSGISHKELCLRLIESVRRRNQLKWEATKRAWKELEHEDFGDFRGLDRVQRRKYLTAVKYSAVDSAIDHCDTWRIRS